MKTELTHARLRELLSYDPETGAFTWNVRRRGVVKARNGSAGGPVHKGEGYIRIKIDGVYYGAHRLAWFYVTGRMPELMIDHIDGDPSNNRIANLREASAALNAENRRSAGKRSRTGMLGVWAPTVNCSQYKASIKVRGQDVHLGRFDTPEAAHLAYVEAKRRLHAGCTI